MYVYCHLCFAQRSECATQPKICHTDHQFARPLPQQCPHQMTAAALTKPLFEALPLGYRASLSSVWTHDPQASSSRLPTWICHSPSPKAAAVEESHPSTLLDLLPLRYGASLLPAWLSTLPTFPSIRSLIELFPPFLLAVPKHKVTHSRKSMRSANKGLKNKTSA